MRKQRLIVVVLVVGIALGLQPAWAQLVVHDPTTTARNAVTAVLKSSVVQTLQRQRDRLQRMAARLSALTSLARYAVDEVPRWRTHAFGPEYFLYAGDFTAALNYGDSTGGEYLRVARVRQAVDAAVLAQLPPGARDAVTRALATLDAADSMLIASTHQTGALRLNGRREMAAMNMQLGRLRDGRAANTSLLTGAGADLRGWRQP